MAAEHAGAAGPDPSLHLVEVARQRAQIHDQHGHHVDAELLKYLANHLERIVEQRDDNLARIADLEAENARLYEGWPEGYGRTAQVWENLAGWWLYEPRQGWPHRGPFATKREAVQASLGLDAPAGGGE